MVHSKTKISSVFPWKLCARTGNRQPIRSRSRIKCSAPAPARCRKLLVLQYTDNCTRILRVCPRTATSTKTPFSTSNKQVQMIQMHHLVGLNKNQELDNRLLFLIVDYLAFLVDFLVVPVVVFFAPPAFLLGTLKSGSSASSPAINDGLWQTIFKMNAL